MEQPSTGVSNDNRNDVNQSIYAPTSDSTASSSGHSVTAIYLVIAFVAARIALYLFFGPQYGYFRDEMYYLACGRHPQWS
jgi:hypothetical protein